MYTAGHFTSRRGAKVLSLLFQASLVLGPSFSYALEDAPTANSPGPAGYEPEVRVSIVPRTRPQVKTRSNELRVDVNVVAIPVTVTDPLGVPVSGLPQQAFKLLEDGVEQRITHFTSEDAPMSVGVLFDASGSMEKKLEPSREAATQLFKTSMPGDEYFLVQFSDSPKLLCGFTQDVADVQNSLSFIQPKGWTSLLDAVYLGVMKMKRAKNSRRALVILSDGADNNSRYRESEIRSLVRESDVTIFAVGMVGWGFSKRSAKLLVDLTEETGGKFFPVSKLSELSKTMTKLSAAMREQYMLSYSPSNPRSDGKYRKVEVKLIPPSDVPPLRASWRVGYYAPDSN